METNESKKFTKTQRYRNKLRYGLVLYKLENRLTKFGLNFKPYYWVQEGMGEYKIPEIKGNSNDYSFFHFGTEKTKIVSNCKFGYNEKIILDEFKNGQICIGLKHNNAIVAYMFIELNDFKIQNKTFKLKDNEAYLLNMHTHESYRGLNLAPYLRYRSYTFLKEMGRDSYFSMTEYFNKSSIKFKKKLNSKHLKLFIYIKIFRICQCTFLIRKYKN